MEFNEQEKALISEITGQAQKFITDKLNGMINNQEFAQKMEALNESIKTETKSVQESLTATLKEQGIAIEELQAMKQRDYKEPTFADQVSKQLNQHIELLKNWKPGQSIEMAITNKAVANMSSANYSGGYIGISAWTRSWSIRKTFTVHCASDHYARPIAGPIHQLVLIKRLMRRLLECKQKKC